MTSAADIAAALRGKPAGNGRFLCSCPVPTHGKGRGDRSPSLCVYDGDKAVLVKCFGGCERSDVIDELRNRGLFNQDRARNRPHVRQSSIVHYRGQSLAKAELSRRSDNLKIAQRIWHEETKPLNSTLGAAYFTVHRGIDLDTLPDIHHCLRWHEAKRMVVALMLDPVTGEGRGIHRIFLNPDGTKREKKMLAPKGIICLTPFEDVAYGLGLTEGIEDGLAIMAHGWGPIWAAPDAGVIKSFPALSGIEAITIWADADEAGKAAARACANRWLKEGQEADIRLPAQS